MTAPAVSERGDGLAEFFAANHRRLARRVGYFAHGAGGTAVDDACAFAWLQLVRRTDINLDSDGYSWLSAVAIHEAWRLARAHRAEQPAGLFWPESEQAGELPEPPGLVADPLDRAIAAELHRTRVDNLAVLKPHELQALGLQALGYRYHELMALTGTSYTAVNRRITEGRARLRQIEGANFP